MPWAAERFDRHAPADRQPRDAVERGRAQRGVDGDVELPVRAQRDPAGVHADVGDPAGDHSGLAAAAGDLASVPEVVRLQRVARRAHRDLGRDIHPVAIEDRDEITADEDYTNVCVSFSFVPEEDWEPGDYSVEIFVNGNAYEAASFTID